MREYKLMVKALLTEYAGSLRRNRCLTQERMAEQLRITGRAYGDLERGKYCFSPHPLLFLLSMLEDDELSTLINEFRRRVYELENRESEPDSNSEDD
jgi:transcriptional regulator with XRE-family HTH domain